VQARAARRIEEGFAQERRRLPLKPLHTLRLKWPSSMHDSDDTSNDDSACQGLQSTTSYGMETSGNVWKLLEDKSSGAIYEVLGQWADLTGGGVVASEHGLATSFLVRCRCSLEHNGLSRTNAFRGIAFVDSYQLVFLAHLRPWDWRGAKGATTDDSLSRTRHTTAQTAANLHEPAGLAGLLSPTLLPCSHPHFSC
jgi:hypothetical protein